ncbi:MAG: hypothetical protein MZU79_04240 [Anaerotruncus sp.]|nr:hypothetical protein [Anaerotruncus sp.]
MVESARLAPREDLDLFLGLRGRGLAAADLPRLDRAGVLREDGRALHGAGPGRKRPGRRLARRRLFLGLGPAAGRRRHRGRGARSRPWPRGTGRSSPCPDRRSRRGPRAPGCRRSAGFRADSPGGRGEVRVGRSR